VKRAFDRHVEEMPLPHNMTLTYWENIRECKNNIWEEMLNDGIETHMHPINIEIPWDHVPKGMNTDFTIFHTEKNY
jgi:hypothetical protein